MVWVPRRVRKIPDPRNEYGSVENPIENLAGFRSDAAWVLLGEPGMGKTTAFQMEAEATDGECLRIEEFIHLDIEPEWREKTLFLDGLDEVRAGSDGESILFRLRQRLKSLGNPPFRIACRAADWYGSTDRADIEAASLDGEITVLLLEPLCHEDILHILCENHGITDSQSFVEEAEKRGITDLLDNPQTLELLVAAVSGGQWPKTRDETYQLACEKLVTETNKRHRDRRRGSSLSVEKALDAAGQLCSVMLLSDKTGFALDQESANERFPELADYAPPDREVARQAIGSKLFRPDGEECVVPSHRSIAEYLAASWLGRRIDGEGLPLQRVLNLLLGTDGGVIAGLRGLFGWLALHCLSARTRLIDADPVTVIVYGDVKPMAATDKRRILAGLRREAERYAAFRQDTWMTAHLFGALADAELRDDFLSILQATERDNASQVLVDCVLDILTHGEAQSEFAPILLDIVRDDTQWPVSRKDALKAWLKLSTDPKEALNLLDDVNEGRVTDSEDELAGMLLQHLYPAYLDPKRLLRCLHKPKNPTLFGSYVSFWEHHLLQKILPGQDHLPILLDGFVDHPELKTLSPYQYHLEQIANTLLVQGILLYGDFVTDDRLFAWLGIGSDKHGYFQRLKNERQAIADWLSARPERYKSLLALCFEKCMQYERSDICLYGQLGRLHGATPPENIGFWHFTQVDLTSNDRLALEHLARAVRTLSDGYGASGFSLELLETWGIAHPERKHWLDFLLACEIPDWRIEEAANKIAGKQKDAEDRRTRAISVTPHLSAIRTGTARVDLMHQLAGVWKDPLIDVHGKPLTERFDSYVENGSEVLAAAEAGFRLCPEHLDLPTVKEIIDLCLEKREHLFRLPCLVGMELRWRDGPEEIENLSDEALRKMIAFRLTYGFENTPAWFVYLVQQHASLVAEVLIAYTSAALQAGKDHIDSIHPLEDDPKYRIVAVLATPSLLINFPISAQTSQLYYLKSLLKAALRYMPKILQLLIEIKLGMKDMDIAQQVYWHAAALLLDPTQNEAALWHYVGKSEARAKHLAKFVSDLGDYSLSAKTVGKMIELIAPHAEIERPPGGGMVTDIMQHGDLVRAFINRLGAMPTPDATQEIERLLAQPALGKLKWLLENARHQQKLHQRESQFRFLSPHQVAQVLANQAPTSAADLAALALDHLDDIAKELRQENDDGFRAFWNVEKKQPTSQREENLCRDTLLTRLWARLKPLGIDCQPEVDYANDKRADIRLSYHTEFELPIEIKRDSNASLWTALRSQLIAQYSIAPRADGHGIYLVLWFDGKDMPRTTDGGKKPCSPEELKIRLEAQLNPIEQQRIFIRVLDVSWPAGELKSNHSDKGTMQTAGKRASQTKPHGGG